MQAGDYCLWQPGKQEIVVYKQLGRQEIVVCGNQEGQRLLFMATKQTGDLFMATRQAGN